MHRYDEYNDDGSGTMLESPASAVHTQSFDISEIKSWHREDLHVFALFKWPHTFGIV